MRNSSKTAAGFRWLKLVAGFVLLLSIPTYSFLDERRGSASFRSDAVPYPNSQEGVDFVGSDGFGHSAWPTDTLSLSQVDPDASTSAGDSSRSGGDVRGSSLHARLFRNSIMVGVPSRTHGRNWFTSRSGRRNPDFDDLSSQSPRLIEDRVDRMEEFLESSQFSMSSRQISYNPFEVEKQRQNRSERKDSDKETPAKDDASDGSPAGGSEGNDDQTDIIENQPGQNKPSGENNTDQEDPTGDSESGEGDGEKKEPEPEPEPDPAPDPAPPAEKPKIRPFDSLVIAPPVQSGEGRLVYRARSAQEGLYQLEDGTSFDALTYMESEPWVGIFSNQRLLSGDLDSDGRTDLILAAVLPSGSYLDIYLRRPNGFEPVGDPFLLADKRLTSFALFDCDNDGRLEIAVVAEGDPDLLFYDIDPDSLELVQVDKRTLPFPAAVVIDWPAADEGGLIQRNLMVFNKTLLRSMALSPTAPEQPSQDLNIPEARPLRAKLSPSRNLDVFAFESSFRVILVESTPQGLVLLANLDASQRIPFGVGGNLLGRRLVVIP